MFLLIVVSWLSVVSAKRLLDIITGTYSVYLVKVQTVFIVNLIRYNVARV